jgi:hypothetical protein
MRFKVVEEATLLQKAGESQTDEKSSGQEADADVTYYGGADIRGGVP